MFYWFFFHRFFPSFSTTEKSPFTYFSRHFRRRSIWACSFFFSSIPLMGSFVSGLISVCIYSFFDLIRETTNRKRCRTFIEVTKNQNIPKKGEKRNLRMTDYYFRVLLGDTIYKYKHFIRRIKIEENFLNNFFSRSEKFDSGFSLSRWAARGCPSK